jgi:hypothetical protein
MISTVDRRRIALDIVGMSDAIAGFVGGPARRIIRRAH